MDQRSCFLPFPLLALLIVQGLIVQGGEVRAETPSRIELLAKELGETRALLSIVQKQLASQALELAELRKVRGATAAPQSEMVAAQDARVSKVEQQVAALAAGAKQVRSSDTNPAIGFALDTVAHYSDRNKEETGSGRPGGADLFIRSAEVTVSGAIDPFAKGYAVITGTDEGDGEAKLGVEEAALVTTALPANATVRVGRFFGEFGRLSYRHDHDLPFVNRPLVLDEYIGGESKTDGVEVNVLLPTERFFSVTAGIGNQFGDAQNRFGGSRGVDQLNFFGRIGTYGDLSAQSNIEVGLSGLFNPSSDGRGERAVRSRTLAGLDLIYRYQPLGATTYRGFEWGSELLFSSNEYEFDGAGNQSLDGGAVARRDAFGMYSYIEGKLSRELSSGFLFDYLQGIADRRDTSLRYSPYLTWKLSEFQFLRFQYSFTDRDPLSGLKDSNEFSIQWSYILGAHAHGFRQR